MATSTNILIGSSSHKNEQTHLHCHESKNEAGCTPSKSNGSVRAGLHCHFCKGTGHKPKQVRCNVCPYDGAAEGCLSCAFGLT